MLLKMKELVTFLWQNVNPTASLPTPRALRDLLRPK
jgi:hypothetical protein